MELAGMAEICQILGVSRQRADALTRYVGFPAPVAELAAGRIWLRSDIVQWAEERQP